MSSKRQKISLSQGEDGFSCFKDLFPSKIVELSVEKAQQNVDENLISNSLVFAKIRIEKKGRGGKTVTILYDLEVAGDVHDIYKVIKKSLGVGGKLIEDALEFSGDIRLRLADFLKDKFNTKLKGALR